MAAMPRVSIVIADMRPQSNVYLRVVQVGPELAKCHLCRKCSYSALLPNGLFTYPTFEVDYLFAPIARAYSPRRPSSRAECILHGEFFGLLHSPDKTEHVTWGSVQMTPEDPVDPAKVLEAASTIDGSSLSRAPAPRSPLDAGEASESQARTRS